MKNKNQDKQVYFKNFQFSIFNFQTLILLIIIIISFIIGYRASKNRTANYQFETDNTEVEVVNSNGEAPLTDREGDSQNNNLEPTVNPLEEGPATIEDLNGNRNNPAGIEHLLEGKDIEVNR